MYVENDDGERMPCGHPGEESDVEEVLGVDFEKNGLSVWQSKRNEPKWWWSKRRKSAFSFVRQRTGYNSYCVCLECLNYLILDLGDEQSIWRSRYGFNREKDKRQCDSCLPGNVKTVFELVGSTCPKCKKGTITEIVTGDEC